MRIQHNIMAMNAYRNYNTNTSALSKNLEKLSSGYKINRAGDDAAGLAISEKMRAQITGLDAAQKNVKDGISLVKTAEGAMQEIQDMLNRMDYLATQSANGTYDNEVDRLNLQKEVDALKSEINRIADSANFNGIKLLDGKAGVNTTAFTKFENVDFTKGNDGSVNISGLLSAENAGATKTHLEGAAVTQANPEAVIDLGDLAVTTASNTAEATLSFSIGGETYEVKLGGAAGTKTSYTKTDIATALKNAMLDGTKNTNAVEISTGANKSDTSSCNAIKIGSNVYKVDTHADGIKLTLAGVGAGTANYKAVATTAPTAATNEFDPTAATAMNSQLGMEVSVTVAGGAKSGEVVHKSTQVVQAAAHVDATKAGIDLKLDDTIVKQGSILEIDGVKFKFELDDATKTSEAGFTVINLAAEKAANADLMHAAADKLSKTAAFNGAGDDTTRAWKIGTGADGATIHIEQTTASTSGKEIDSYKKLTDKISVKGSATPATGNGVAITIDPTKIAAGNKLNIDGKTYTFVEGSADAAKGEVSIDGDAIANLRTALSADYTTELKAGTGDDADKKVLTIRAKVANATEAAASTAPVINGEGLMLQIGDTSDSYNQLAVKIGDMHTTALGIDKLDISNPEGASAAIQTIRDAINQVSGVRGDLGAIQNRLEHTANNLSVMAENIQDAESTIRDTDVAEEMMSYTKNNILIQSAQAMLAQANQVPQGVLQLLQ